MRIVSWTMFTGEARLGSDPASSPSVVGLGGTLFVDPGAVVGLGGTLFVDPVAVVALGGTLFVVPGAVVGLG